MTETPLFQRFKVKYPDAKLSIFPAGDGRYEATVEFNFQGGPTGPRNIYGATADTIEEAIDYAVLTASSRFWKYSNLPRIRDYDKKFSLETPITLQMVMQYYPKPKYDTYDDYLRCCERMCIETEATRQFLKSKGLVDGDKITKAPLSKGFYDIYREIIAKKITPSESNAQCLVNRFRVQTVDLYSYDDDGKSI